MEHHKFAYPVGYYPLAIPDELVDLIVAEVDNIKFEELE